MSRSAHPRDPLNGLLVAAGILFSITACAYGAMAFRAVRGPVQPTSAAGQALLAALDRYGLWILGAELALLAAATVGVIVRDQLHEKRLERQAAGQPHQAVQHQMADGQGPDAARPLAAPELSNADDKRPATQ